MSCPCLGKRSVQMQSDIFVRRLFTHYSSLFPVSLPSPREIHCWYTSPDEIQKRSLQRQYLELLSPSEREHVLSIKVDRLQKAALLSRALVRTTIARYTNNKVSPDALKFRCNTFGKPEVEWQTNGSWVPPHLHFNVSHTSSLIACAVTADVPIGIDIEEKQRQLTSSILSLAKRYFSRGEVEFLSGLGEKEAQREGFLKLWTLKEAYVKALGRGFSGAPFKDFTIQARDKAMQNVLQSQGTKIIVEPRREAEVLTADWHFALLELATSHYAALCTKKRGAEEEGTDGSLQLKVWKVVPLVSDENVSGTPRVVPIVGLSDRNDPR